MDYKEQRRAISPKPPKLKYGAAGMLDAIEQDSERAAALEIAASARATLQSERSDNRYERAIANHKINELQKKVDELQKKYDSLQSAITFENNQGLPKAISNNMMAQVLLNNVTEHIEIMTGGKIDNPKEQEVGYFGNKLQSIQEGKNQQDKLLKLHTEGNQKLLNKVSNAEKRIKELEEEIKCYAATGYGEDDSHSDVDMGGAWSEGDNSGSDDGSMYEPSKEEDSSSGEEDDEEKISEYMESMEVDEEGKGVGGAEDSGDDGVGISTGRGGTKGGKSKGVGKTRRSRGKEGTSTTIDSGTSYKEPVILQTATESVSDGHIIQHFDRYVPKDKKVRDDLVSTLPEKDQERIKRLQQHVIDTKHRVFKSVELLKQCNDSKPVDLPTAIHGVAQDLMLSFYCMMKILNGDTMTNETTKDALTMVIPSLQYANTAGISLYNFDRLLKSVQLDGEGGITKYDLHFESGTRSTLYSPAVSLTDRLNGERRSFGISATMGSPNLDTKLRDYNFTTKTITLDDNTTYKPNVKVDPSKITCLLVLEKKEHVKDLAKEDNKNKDDDSRLKFTAISAGGRATDDSEAYVMAKIIMDEYKAASEGKDLIVLSAFDLNGAGLDMHKRYGITNMKMLITPKAVEELGVKFVGAVKTRTASTFQNALVKARSDDPNFGNPKAHVNIDELVTRVGDEYEFGGSVGKLILYLAKKKLAEDNLVV